MYGRTHRIHMIGIGGSGMSGVAQGLLTVGYQGAGSDLKTGDATQRVVQRGGRGVSVITNVDREHMDHYGTLEELRQAFVYFANRVPFYGVAVLCVDDPEVRGLLPRVTKRMTTYGTRAEADVRGEDIRLVPHGSRFRVRAHQQELGEIELHVPGRHNVLNALAAAAVRLPAEVGFGHIAQAHAGFPRGL